MRLEVPYIEQKTDHTCGPAVMRMLANFFDIDNVPSSLSEILGTSTDDGTDNKDMVSGAKRLGLSVRVRTGASISDIKRSLERGVPVVVNFIEPRGKREGHHSLVIGLEGDEIIFNDPAYGEGFRMKIQDFERDWKSGFEDYERWMMTVDKKISFRNFFHKLFPVKVFSKF